MRPAASSRHAKRQAPHRLLPERGGWCSVPGSRLIDRFLIQKRKSLKLFGATGCSKIFPPNANHLDEGACRNLWKQAKKEFMNLPDAIKRINKYINIFKRADQIHVENGNSPEDPYVCYRPEVYKARGWCEVATKPKTARTWGICSPSCKYFVSLVIALVAY